MRAFKEQRNRSASHNTPHRPVKRRPVKLQGLSKEERDQLLISDTEKLISLFLDKIKQKAAEATGLQAAEASVALVNAALTMKGMKVKPIGAKRTR